MHSYGHFLHQKADRVCGCPIIVKERTVTQFISSDLTVIRESILQSTGIKIAGILGTPAIKELGMIIDLRRGIVTLSENITKSK